MPHSVYFWFNWTLGPAGLSIPSSKFPDPFTYYYVILHNLVIIANMELLALSRNAAGTGLPTHDTVVS